MPDCECIPICPFFNDQMAFKPALAAMCKSAYCHDNNGNCARYRVLKQLSREAVPLDLYPTMLAEAAALLETARNKG